MKITLTDLPSKFFLEDGEHVDSIEIEIPDHDIMNVNIESKYDYDDGRDNFGNFRNGYTMDSMLNFQELIFRFTMCKGEYSTIINKKEK